MSKRKVICDILWEKVRDNAERGNKSAVYYLLTLIKLVEEQFSSEDIEETFNDSLCSIIDTIEDIEPFYNK